MTKSLVEWSGDATSFENDCGDATSLGSDVVEMGGIAPPSEENVRHLRAQACSVRGMSPRRRGTEKQS